MLLRKERGKGNGETNQSPYHIKFSIQCCFLTVRTTAIALLLLRLDSVDKITEYWYAPLSPSLKNIIFKCLLVLRTWTEIYSSAADTQSRGEGIMESVMFCQFIINNNRLPGLLDSKYRSLKMWYFKLAKVSERRVRWYEINTSLAFISVSLTLTGFSLSKRWSIEVA